MIFRLAVLFVLILSSSAGDAGETENVALVRAMAELINDRKLDELHTVIAENVVRHSDATPDVVVTNIDEFIAFLRTDIATVPDSVQEIEQIFGSGDMVALRAKYRGTQLGPMGPFPPSGKTLELVFIAILRIENHKVAEIWVEWDNLSALGQLGHLPPPE